MGWVGAYLDRIGTAAPPRPDLAGLRRLHEAHVRSVPFENLSVALGEPVSLDRDAVVAKVVGRHRGGFCYELNGLFAHLLVELGYRVTLLAARVWTEAGWGLPFDHLLLRVDCPEPWLVDVGFGAHSRYPLRLDVSGDQVDPAGTFRITRTPDGDLDVAKDGIPQYRVETRPRTIDDFAGMCWYHQSSPDSHFTQNVVCSRADGDGRLSISGDRVIRTVGGDQVEEVLVDEAAVRRAYAEHFGIVLTRLP